MHKYLVYLIQSESISITCGNDLLNEQNTAKLNTNKILDIQRRNDNIFTFSSLRHIWKCISVGRMAAVVGLTLLPPRLVFAFPLVIFFFFHLFAHFNFNYELCSESLFRITIFHLTGTGGTNSASRWTSRSSRTVTIEIINILRRLQANAIDWNRRFICLIFHTNWWNNNNDNDTREYLIWLLKSWHDSLIPLVSRKCIHTNAHTLSNISAVVIIILCSIFIFV